MAKCHNPPYILNFRHLNPIILKFSPISIPHYNSPTLAINRAQHTGHGAPWTGAGSQRGRPRRWGRALGGAQRRRGPRTTPAAKFSNQPIEGEVGFTWFSHQHIAYLLGFHGR